MFTKIRTSTQQGVPGTCYSALLDFHHGVIKLAYGEGFEYAWLRRFRSLFEHNTTEISAFASSHLTRAVSEGTIVIASRTMYASRAQRT